MSFHKLNNDSFDCQEKFKYQRPTSFIPLLVRGTLYLARCHCRLQKYGDNLKERRIKNPWNVNYVNIETYMGGTTNAFYHL